MVPKTLQPLKNTPKYLGWVLLTFFTIIFIILIFLFTKWVLADYQTRMIEHNNHYACVYGHSECEEENE